MAEGAIGNLTSVRYQARHIELNAGNVLSIVLLSEIGHIFFRWTSNWAARTEIPVVSQLGIGIQNALNAN